MKGMRGHKAADPRGLRFAMLTTFYPPYSFGGDAVFVQRLAHSLARRGHSVDVIHDCDAYEACGGKPKAPIEAPPGVRVHSLRSRTPMLTALATHQLGRPVVHGRAIRQILRRGFDVVHFHNVSLIGGPGLLDYGEGVKLYTAHEHWLVCPTHILWRYGRELCTGRECLRCQVSAKRPPQLWRRGSLLRRQSRKVDVFLGLSEFSVRKHKEFGFEAPMEVMPSFLPDDDDCTTGEGSLPERKGRRPVARPYFLFVGRLEEIKGLDELIPQFDGDLAADLLIAGSSPSEDKFRALAAGHPSVHFLGHCSFDELRSLYRDALALVVPSRCFEVFPLVVLEAFREGTPIVARRLGPFPEIVDQSEGGLLFDGGDELRAAMLRLLNEPRLRDQLGDNARRAFQMRWSEDVAMSRYFSVIRRVAQQRGLQSVLEKFVAGGAYATRE